MRDLKVLRGVDEDWGLLGLQAGEELPALQINLLPPFYVSVRTDEVCYLTA
jgi:hypothetical protein